MKNVANTLSKEEGLRWAAHMAHSNAIEGNPMKPEERTFIDTLFLQGVTPKEIIRIIIDAAKETIDPAGNSPENDQDNNRNWYARQIHLQMN
jgi:hypothetical protein